jgi:hypothetical protein
LNDVSHSPLLLRNPGIFVDGFLKQNMEAQLLFDSLSVSQKEEPLSEESHKVVPNPQADKVDLSELRGTKMESFELAMSELVSWE